MLKKGLLEEQERSQSLQDQVVTWSVVFTLLRTNKLSDQSKRNILKKRRRGNGSRALQVVKLTKRQMFEI